MEKLLLDLNLPGHKRSAENLTDFPKTLEHQSGALTERKKSNKKCQKHEILVTANNGYKAGHVRLKKKKHKFLCGIIHAHNLLTVPNHLHSY